MAFHDTSLPDVFRYGSAFGAGFMTVVQETSTGHEYRLARQSQSRHRYRLAIDLQSQSEAATLKAFALARRGALHSFRLKDWSDYSSNADGTSSPSSTDQIIGVGDGAETRFQLTKTYDLLGYAPYSRPIELPVEGSVLLAVNGTPTTATVTNPGGIVTLASPPSNGSIVTAGFEFQVPVRFGAETDSWMAMQADAFAVWSLQQTECIEVLNEIAWPELRNPGGSKAHGAIGSDTTISYAQGLYHSFAPTTDINVFLPIPKFGGSRHFVIAVLSGSDVQLRADDGSAIGSPISPISVVNVACHVAGGSFAWQVY